MNKLKQINQKIRLYWLEKAKKLTKIKKVHKNKVPSFTRHNGNRIKALMDSGWRKPKGSHGNKLTKPKIGYKRPAEIRFRRKTDGLLFKVISNLMELNCQLKPYEVIVISSKVGAKKRQLILKEAETKKIPIYIPKI